VAASLPALVGRNPFVLAATLLAVLGVHAAWRDAPGHRGWRGLLRLALLFAAVGVLFNVLTVHVGDLVFARLPDGWPIVGGPLTVNALVYGLLGAVAVTTLVLVGTTLGRVLDWAALLRLLPPRLSTVAVAGSVAWAFVPQTAVAFGEIREAQAARGHRPRGVRDLLPLLVPLLAGGLERAMTLAEALEARAFGAPLTAEAAARPWRRAATVLGLSAGALGGYLLAVGRAAAAIASLTVAAVALAAAGREPGGAVRPRRTRYREPRWGRPETTIALAAGMALAVQVATLALDPGAFAYEPYPSLTAPSVSLPTLAALGLLLAPAAVAP
jgi:energy-coupling factor transport system permease protein